MVINIVDVGWLRRQAVAWSLGSSGSLGSLADVLARLEFVQADPIRSPARAQDLILRQRVSGYRAGDLERLYPRLGIDEDYLYAYGFVTRRLTQLLHPRGSYVPDGPALDVLALVRERGVLHPRDADAALGSGTRQNAWGSQSSHTTLVLHGLHHHGLIRVVRRDRGVRVYGPVTDTVALSPLSSPLLSPAARVAELTMVVARLLAPVPAATLVTTVGHLARSIAGSTGRAVVAELLASGALATATCDGIAYAWPADLMPSDRGAGDRVRFLAPFDPVVWDRRRFGHLWGWDYRFEAYTPPAKRTMGYYAMPVLWRDHVIGWATASRSSSPLDVTLGFAGSRPASIRFERAVEAEVERLRRFLGAGVDIP